MPSQKPAHSSWLERPLFSNFKLTWEIGIFILIIVLALVTRFYILGERVISHDETTHVYFSWLLSRGQGYQHHPLSHGPFQFHALALSYFLFGDNDFTARVPQALFGVLAIAFLWYYRRYLGRVGAVVAAFIFLISPYMLYYARYARNEAFVMLFGLVMLWAMLRYLDRGEDKYLYIFTAATSLHFASKETAFIYAAQALLFLGFLFLWRIGGRRWGNVEGRRLFLIVLLLSASLFVLAVGAQIIGAETTIPPVTGTEVQEPVIADGAEIPAETLSLAPAALILGAVGLVTLGIAMYFLVRGYGWPRLRQERSFGLLLLLFTLVLPHLSAFPISWLGREPMNVNDTNNLIFMGIVIAVLAAVSVAFGLLWKPRVWLINLAIFYAIFIPLFTTVFTNGVGFFTGLVGSLGYWLEQQGVERGSQPWYFYWAVQIPIYEYLAAAGTVLAAVLGVRLWRQPARPSKKLDDTDTRNLTPAESRRLALSLLAFWAVTALAAYTIAGEKMPWLTTHIALPMILLAGWALGWVIRRVDWAAASRPRGLLTILLIGVFLFSLFNLFGALLGANPPFRGPEQTQLIATYRFLLYVLLSAGSFYGLTWLASEQKWEKGQLNRLILLFVFAGLAFLTTRASMRASFINYDSAAEYLVYAHMARGPKEIMEQIDEISLRITDGYDLQVAYDNETTYPFWWYLRNYPNNRYYADQPGRDLRDAPVILVGDTNYGKIEPVVADDYYMFEYIRIWWPNQDYFEFQRETIAAGYSGETGNPPKDMSSLEYLRRLWGRIKAYIDTPEEREALYQVWLNRDFRAYLEGRGVDPSPARWNPSRTMRMYIRKDIAAQIWDYGVQPVAAEELVDPYEGKGVELPAELIIGGIGNAPGQFNSPRDVAMAPDGSLYVADSNNHRIQHFSAEGEFLDEWGSFADLNLGNAPGGTFFEPWSVAVSPDGRFVYVADTWNHRIQKFTANGQFIEMWGAFGQDQGEFSMWGPRDLLVDEDGNVLVVDTGNKRIKVYDANGNFISQYGEFGLGDGQFDEPVGIALDELTDRLYLADTWNQRVQVFSYLDGVFQFLESWEIAGWYGQSLINKPYLAVGSDSRVYITDPEASRVLVYNPDGILAFFFGGFDQSAVDIAIAQGIAAGDGVVWVSDSQNNRLLKFLTP